MHLLKTAQITAILFVVILVGLHIIKREIDPSWQPISEYALGKSGWMMNLAFLLLGASFLSLGWYAFKVLPKIGAKVGGVLLIVSAFGNFLAGIFNTDPAGTLPDQMTTSGQWHGIGASLLALMLIATILLTWQFFKQPTLRAKRQTMLFATILLWFFEISLIIAMGVYLGRNDGVLSVDTPIGWWGRLVIVCCAAWIWLCSRALRSLSGAPAGRQ